MTSLKLYRGADVIGLLTAPSQDGPQTLANLELTPAADKHRELLEYMTTPNPDGIDPPASLRLFDDWFIEDENGVKKEIFYPAIRPDAKFLSWRWKRRVEAQ